MEKSTDKLLISTSQSWNEWRAVVRNKKTSDDPTAWKKYWFDLIERDIFLPRTWLLTKVRDLLFGSNQGLIQS